MSNSYTVQSDASSELPMHREHQPTGFVSFCFCATDGRTVSFDFITRSSLAVAVDYSYLFCTTYCIRRICHGVWNNNIKLCKSLTHVKWCTIIHDSTATENKLPFWCSRVNVWLRFTFGKEGQPDGRQPLCKHAPETNLITSWLKAYSHMSGKSQYRHRDRHCVSVGAHIVAAGRPARRDRTSSYIASMSVDGEHPPLRSPSGCGTFTEHRLHRLHRATPQHPLRLVHSCDLIQDLYW